MRFILASEDGLYCNKAQVPSDIQARRLTQGGAPLAYPIIRVDSKKKELVGQFKNNGRV